jgi:tetratricopeptide (TPR) repeat protein
VVGGFQALFDDDAPQPRAGVADDETAGLLGRLAELTARQQFAEALRVVNAVLMDRPTLCARDSRFAWLRARLLAGIAGQPRSVAVLDLAAAERAFLDIVARAGRAEAAAALTAAGRCAYADGRFNQAGTHYRAALERDPGAADACYQLARLFRHAADMDAVREALVLAFAIAYGYALRAASDPLFRADVPLLRECVRAAAQRAAHATQDSLGESLERLRFLACRGDRDFPVRSLARFAPVRDEIVSLVRAPAAATLRKALRRRKAARATHAPLAQLAQDYCALLRQNEEAIGRRGVQRRTARDAGRVARWLTRGTEASVVGVLIAVVAGTFDLAVAAPFPDWNATASSSALGLALAVFHLWLMMHTSFLRQPTRSFFERAVGRLQARSRARFERRVPGRIARNRRKLEKRIARIERRFGMSLPES